MIIEKAIGWSILKVRHGSSFRHGKKNKERKGKRFFIRNYKRGTDGMNMEDDE